MQYTSLPDGFTIQELDASHLEQFNALLRYAFQVTEEELVQVGWQEDEIKQSKFPILESAHVLGCFEGKTLAAQIAVYPMQVNVEGVKVRIEAINKKVENLTVDFMSANRDIRYEIKQLQDAQETVITVLEHKKILSGVG